jgi:hypothetical protein
MRWISPLALRKASWGLMKPGISDFSAGDPPIRRRLTMTSYNTNSPTKLR